MKKLYLVLLILFSTNMLYSQGNSNVFNPDISLILNGKYEYINTQDSYNSKFNIDESELTLSSSIDDKFSGSFTLSILDSQIELEEAYIYTQALGVNIKAGRALWDIGYLNSHHPHSDNFSTRPLAYEFFLDEAFANDGIQFSYVMPIKYYLEIGGGVYGVDYNNEGITQDKKADYTLYLRAGGDISTNQDYRIGGYLLSQNESSISDVSLLNTELLKDTYVLDAKYNIFLSNNKSIVFLAEGYYSKYKNNDDDAKGYYASVVYNFSSKWSIGESYSQIFYKEEQSKYKANENIVMLAWKNSEFATIRLQYNFLNDISNESKEHKLMVNYIVSLGAHSAHSY